jgi:pyruvate-formate lyase-activating enzyme
VGKVPRQCAAGCCLDCGWCASPATVAAWSAAVTRRCAIGRRKNGRPADRPEQGRDTERAHPGRAARLDTIDGLQTQVATAETETETARTAAREAAQAAEVLRKTGAEAELRARGFWRVSGEHGGGSDDIRSWWHDCGRRDGGVKGMTTPRAILVGDM